MRDRYIKKAEAIVGRRFHDLTVVSIGEVRGTKEQPVRFFECLCDCGKKTFATGAELKKGHTKSCGCWRQERNALTPRQEKILVAEITDLSYEERTERKKLKRLLASRRYWGKKSVQEKRAEVNAYAREARRRKKEGLRSQARNAHRQGESPQGRAAKMVNYAQKRAIYRGEAPTVTVARVAGALEQGVCEVTGMSFCFDPGSPWAPSLDRRDPRVTYTDDNVRVVVWLYNAAKVGYTDAHVMTMAKALVATEPS